ncbi:MAG: SRPBCC family protein, partial [Alphaproteobacteria bacterium]
YAAWTDPEQLPLWWGPKSVSVPEAQLDIREGGKWRTVFLMPSGERHAVGGEYRRLIPPTHIAFTWEWEHAAGAHGPSLVTVDFEAQGEGTLMRFKQSGITDATRAGQHKEGWISTFECLADYLPG